MQTTTLSVTRRDGAGKNVNRRLRVDGITPAVVYGGDGENLNIGLRAAPLVALLKGKMGQNALIQLDVNGEQGPIVIVRDYQLHPVRRTLLHVDFLRVDATSSLVVNVPVEIVGRAETEKAGGKRRVVTTHIKVRCAPQNIPDAIRYDVSALTGSKVVYVTELEMPEGVEAVFRRTFPILSITAPKVVAKVDDGADAKKKKKK